MKNLTQAQQVKKNEMNPFWDRKKNDTNCTNWTKLPKLTKVANLAELIEMTKKHEIFKKFPKSDLVISRITAIFSRSKIC